MRPAASTDSPQRADPPAGRARLLIGIAAGALWLAALAGLALLTANPVTLNVGQIRRADAIVSARVSPRDSGTITIEETWRGELDSRELRVSNLSKAGAKPGRSYLIPLSRVGEDRYKVTESELPGDLPLIYPASEESIEQLTAILRN